jgi:hypothetical protein
MKYNFVGETSKNHNSTLNSHNYIGDVSYGLLHCSECGLKIEYVNKSNGYSDNGYVVEFNISKHPKDIFELTCNELCIKNIL